MTKKSDENSADLENLAQENGELLQNLQNLTNDLQRTRADFENYRKRIDEDLARVSQKSAGKTAAKILPILDIFDKVFANLPENLRESDFGKGIILAQKNLEKTCAEINLQKINVKIGDEFNHEFMNAISVEGDGENEIVAEVLQSGYVFDGEILRAAMVKIARK